MKLRTSFLLLLTSLGSLSYAQTAKTFTDPANLRGERVKPRDGRELPIDQGAAGLQQMLRKLGTRASILNIVAHPDDEDGGMLTFYSRGAGARVADLSLTRGEGGQNAMTGDFEDALGLLRTQELLACDRYSGIDQFFGTEVDFGFSKTKEEAFAKWTHERVLYDAVRAVRLYRPLVLTATFIGGVTDGHGQHQVSGEIAQEVFNAAGDPKIFPELTAEGILPWQPLKVFARVPSQSISEKGLFDYATNQYTEVRFKNYATGEETMDAPSADVVVHEGQPDSLLKDADGKTLSYVQFARMGLAQQKSQTGPGMRPPLAGKFDVSYHLYGTRVKNQPKIATDNGGFFDGVDTSLQGIEELAPGAFPAGMLAYVQRAIGTANEQFDAAHPEAVAGALAVSMKTLDDLMASVQKWDGDELQRASALHELRVKRAQFSEAMALALGLTLDATADRAELVQGKPEAIRLQVKESSSSEVVTRFEGTSASGPSVKPAYTYAETKTPATVTPSVITEPYFYRDNIEQPVYKLRDSALRNAPATPATLTAWSTYAYEGVSFEVGRVVHAEGQQAVRVVPTASLSLSAHAQVLPDTAKSSAVTSILHPATTPALEPKLALPAGWTSQVAASEKPSPGETNFTILAPAAQRSAITVKASATTPDGRTVTQGYRPIGYGDIPRTNYYTAAEDTIVPVDLKLPAKHHIGYLPGTGDAVPEALASVGMKPDILTLADLTADKLKPFDTVILGVRTYAALPGLHGAPTKALLDYARGGGNVVVQTQTAEFTGDDAPYPLTLGRDAEKVVDETDAVQLLEAKSPLLNAPNHITPADFDHWIEERGHGFLQTWDPKYTALTETHDPGEAAQKGGLITTQIGTGQWTYCAYAIYRQLPEAVPGAYRVFVNLLQKAPPSKAAKAAEEKKGITTKILHPFGK
jgi:LmbE family N-acetylglucosaminyl deacetylase